MPPSEPLYSLPGSNNIPAEVASRQQAGGNCPYCPTPIKVGALIRVCPSCRTIHHGRCWEKNGRCGGFDCSTSRRELSSASADVMVISSEELERVTPLPPRPPATIARPIYRPSSSGPVVNRLAIIAMVTAFAGIPFFGLLTGFLAIGMAVVALVRIEARHEKGKGLAIGALILGSVDIIGWIIFLNQALSGTSLDQIFHERARPKPPARHGSIGPGDVPNIVSITVAAEGLQSS